jgi:3-hydroxymyristoyl/3-hydroxydecanoyl-(acyl carrier protein) dehydratase
VEPGDRLDITVTLIRRKRDIWRCGAEARVDDALAASADILFTYRAL